MKNYPKEREDWLMVEHYSKLSKRENPHNIGCLYCFKTHLPANCENRKTVVEPEKTENKSMYDYTEDPYDNPNNYGW